ncbi:MAG: hypothetical protein H7251_02265 [Acetobacteraceae bacterium]|nr:hypothetical protein [Acetobacteraceae bacterium]
MNSLVAPLTPRKSLKDCAPELAPRLAGILLGVAALVARRFLREPRLVALIGPVWRWLSRAAGRFERSATAAFGVRAERAARDPGARVRKVGAIRLPTQRGWLVRELGWEAAGYGSQLAHLLAEPEMQALIVAMPGVGRVLRPLCRMLGYDLAAVTMMVAPAATLAVAAEEAAQITPQIWPRDDAVGLDGVIGEKVVFSTSG